MAGGAEIQLHQLMRRLVEWGHDVTWLACSYPGAAAEQMGDDGIRYRRRGKWQLTNFSMPGLAKDELRRRPYDVVLDDINKVPFFSPLFTKLPVMAMVPHLFGRTVFRETGPLSAAYVYLMEKPIPWVYRNSWFSVVSASTARDMETRGIDPARIEVIHCGMDHERYVRETPPPRNDHPTLLHLGRLRKYKSVDVVIRAFAQIRSTHPRAELNIVGEGPDEARLRGVAAQLGLSDAVHFRGFLPREEIVDLLYRTHLFLNPSPKEGWGLTVIEANECGVPVVASRRPGLMDSVRDQETGVLVPYGDHAAFATAALELLADRDRWQAYSEAAVAWARSFDWDTVARQTEALLQRSIEEAN